jgi:hypothetical protein
MNNQNCHYANCEKDVTGTNLLLAQLLLKTTNDKTKITDNPALLSIVQSLCNTSQLYFSRPTPLQLPNKDFIVDSRATYDSTNTCDLSLSLPSSVHVEQDVTHDICHAYEPTASHGVSSTANEKNVSRHEVSDSSEGLSFLSISNASESRKRPSDLSTDTAQIPIAKRISQEMNYPGTERGVICSLSNLVKYVEQNIIKSDEMRMMCSKMDVANEGMFTFSVIYLILIHQSNATLYNNALRSIRVCA